LVKRKSSYDDGLDRKEDCSLGLEKKDDLIEGLEELKVESYGRLKEFMENVFDDF